mmetsp:Transcript_37010/g.87954  ORF Transcript_37010/g.87954 Transcript_37010/m.87954 type:complete len:302 (+) Transcript_37010:1688-2593(+)
MSRSGFGLFVDPLKRRIKLTPEVGVVCPKTLSFLHETLFCPGPSGGLRLIPPLHQHASDPREPRGADPHILELALLASQPQPPPPRAGGPGKELPRSQPARDRGEPLRALPLHLPLRVHKRRHLAVRSVEAHLLPPRTEHLSPGGGAIVPGRHLCGEALCSASSGDPRERAERSPLEALRAVLPRSGPELAPRAGVFSRGAPPPEQRPGKVHLGDSPLDPLLLSARHCLPQSRQHAAHQRRVPVLCCPCELLRLWPDRADEPLAPMRECRPRSRGPVVLCGAGQRSFVLHECEPPHRLPPC